MICGIHLALKITQSFHVCIANALYHINVHIVTQTVLIYDMEIFHITAALYYLVPYA